MHFFRTPPSFGAFALLLAVLLVFPLRQKAGMFGDAEEYILMTKAIATHGSPAILPGDLTQLKEPQGFSRGSDGATYAIHFFGYPALAALPYKLLQAAGANPLKCFQVVNLLALFILGLTLFRFFGSAGRAFAGLILFMLTGGALYWNWSSPEVLSAAALLAAFLWFAMGAPIYGGLLAGLASMQNPTIVFSLAFLPMLNAWRDRSLSPLFKPRMIAGLALGGMLFSLAPLFNLAKFGTPSIIAKTATSSALVSGERLFSLFFDLNQGMLVAMPAVAIALLCLGWRKESWRRELLLSLLCLASMLAFCLPALSVVNWNSGAAGVMRYAFWAAMPLLFVVLHRLRSMADWPRTGMVALLLVQALAMAACLRYSHLQFSPQASWVMNHVPHLYNPEPELFVERSMGNEAVLQAMQAYQWKDKHGIAVKTLYFTGPGAPLPGESLCGSGQTINGSKPPVSAAPGWEYLNGPVECRPAVNLDAAQPGLLASGWQAPDVVGDKVSGVWGVAATASLVIDVPDGVALGRVRVLGDYLPGTISPRSHIIVNGRDMGWQDLRAPVFLELPHDGARRLTIELHHDQPLPDEGRQLTFYLKSITLI